MLVIDYMKKFFDRTSKKSGQHHDDALSAGFCQDVA